jgi:hypothetical protein
MTCPHCGAAVPAGTAVCPVCKGVLEVSSASTGRLPAPPDPPPTARLDGGPLPLPGYQAPNPYAGPPFAGVPSPGPAPAGWTPSPPAGPYAAPLPPASPYNMMLPATTPPVSPVAATPRQGKQAFLWIGVGLLALSLVLFLCVGLVVAFGTPAEPNSVEEIYNLRLGGAICAVGVLFVLGVPGAILFFLGVRR